MTQVDDKVVAAAGDEGDDQPVDLWWERLRDPFPSERIGKLPRSTKRDNPKGRCNECGGWHGIPAVHLDYVSHADVTDRLLSVDPFWNWEPTGWTDGYQPFFVRNNEGHPIGLWIWLTVRGVRRLGYGSVEPGATEPEKQLIGDALRNAAMRFGVALDLWRKEDGGHRDDDAQQQPRFTGNTSGTAVPTSSLASTTVPAGSVTSANPAPANNDFEPRLGKCQVCGSGFKRRMRKDQSGYYYKCVGKNPATGEWCNNFAPKWAVEQLLAGEENQVAEAEAREASHPISGTEAAAKALEAFPGAQVTATQVNQQVAADVAAAAPTNPKWMDTVQTLQKLPENLRLEVTGEYGIPKGSPAKVYRDLDPGKGEALYETAKQYLDNYNKQMSEAAELDSIDIPF